MFAGARQLHIRSALQDTATQCKALQHTTTHCDTLQHIATHCSALQHTPICLQAPGSFKWEGHGKTRMWHARHRSSVSSTSTSPTACNIVRTHRIQDWIADNIYVCMYLYMYIWKHTKWLPRHKSFVSSISTSPTACNIVYAHRNQDWNADNIYVCMYLYMYI